MGNEKSFLEKQEDTLEFIQKTGGCTKNQMYAALKYSRKMLTRILDELERKGAVERRIIGKIYWYYIKKNDRRTKRPSHIEKAWGVEILRT